MREYVSVGYILRDGSEQSTLYRQGVRNVILHGHNIKEIDLRPIEYCPFVEHINLRANQMEHLDLEPLSRCPNLKSVNLAENKLVHLELHPIHSLSNLEELDLSWNRFRDIDLSPLEGLKNLKHLDVSHNRLDHIELYPLATCENLTEFNLKGNGIQKMNISPLLMCMNLRKLDVHWNFDLQPAVEVGLNNNSFSAVVVDALLRNALEYGKPPWLKDTGLISQVRIPDSEALIRELGWEKVRDGIRNIFKARPLPHSFQIQKKLFDRLEMGELFGLDCGASEMLSLIPDLMDIRQGLDELYARIVKRLKKQFNDGGSTLFFNVEKLSTTRGAVIVEPLIRRRKKELEELTLSMSDKYVDLKPLWFTGYGFEILRKLGVGVTVSLQRFKSMISLFEELGFDLKYGKKPASEKTTGNVCISNELKKLVFDSIRSGGELLTVQSQDS